MSGNRDAIVYTVAAILLVASVAAGLAIADARFHDEDVVKTQQADGDWDGDGVPDATDACATQPETYNGFRDQDGCPDTATRTRAS